MFRNQKGFSLLEVIIALFMITVGLLAILGLANYYLKTTAATKNRLIASFLAQEGIEIVRYFRENEGGWDWDSWYGSDLNGIYCPQFTDTTLSSARRPNIPLKIDNSNHYQYTSGANTPFSRTMTITKLSSGKELKVSVEVKWQERGVQQSVIAEDRLWNWR